MIYNIILTVLITLASVSILGFYYNQYKATQLKRDEDLFIFMLEGILANKNETMIDRIYKAKELCRNTTGKIAAGAYLALDSLNEM